MKNNVIDRLRIPDYIACVHNNHSDKKSRDSWCRGKLVTLNSILQTFTDVVGKCFVSKRSKSNKHHIYCISIPMEIYKLPKMRVITVPF